METLTETEDKLELITLEGDEIVSNRYFDTKYKT